MAGLTLVGGEFGLLSPRRTAVRPGVLLPPLLGTAGAGRSGARFGQTQPHPQPPPSHQPSSSSRASTTVLPLTSDGTGLSSSHPQLSSSEYPFEIMSLHAHSQMGSEHVIITFYHSSQKAALDNSFRQILPHDNFNNLMLSSTEREKQKIMSLYRNWVFCLMAF